MKDDEGLKNIGEMDFHDIKVKIYYDKHAGYSCNAIWRMRNPSSCYTGIVYHNPLTNKITYPEGAVIPVQTDRDKEMLPMAVLVNTEQLDDEMMKTIMFYLDTSYMKRNGCKI